MTSPSNPLPSALDALVGIGVAAGLEESSVRAEGVRLAAGVVNTAAPSQVHLGWQEVMGGTTQEFFLAASQGRRFASGPTPLLAHLVRDAPEQAREYASALLDVATAACTVPGADAGAAGRATTTGQCQLAAVGASSPAGSGPSGLPSSGVVPSGPSVPGAAPGSTPGSGAPGVGSTSLLDGGVGAFPGLPTSPSTPASHLPEARLTSQSVLDQLSALTRATRDLWGGGAHDGGGGQTPGATGMPGAPGLPGFPTPTLTDPADPAGTPPSTGSTPPVGATSPGGTPGSPGAPQAAAPASDGGPAPSPAPAPPTRSVEELLAELDALTGLRRVKREVHQQVAMLKVDAKRREAGLKSASMTRHLVFVGNPGTGKTTVARLVGGIYHALGLLSSGQLVEVDRSELVAGYLGQTAAKTAEVAASAVGGVLFIDEAYTLAGDQYGQEAVDTLVKEMEDRRDELVVIVAGYPAPMERFIATNPGLASRFRTTITFDDYTDDEITDILHTLAEKNDYVLTDAATTRFREILAATPRDDSFGNGRFARNVLEAAIGRHAWRIQDMDDPSIDDLRTLDRIDLEDRTEDPPPPAGAAFGVPMDTGEMRGLDATDGPNDVEHDHREKDGVGHDDERRADDLPHDGDAHGDDPHEGDPRGDDPHEDGTRGDDGHEGETDGDEVTS